MAERTATIKRETRETFIHVTFNIDGNGNTETTTGLRMFDHLLAQLTQHGIFDLKLSATSADHHHMVEDVALCLGRAFGEALGEKRGIVRMAHAIVPMDDALAMVAIDIGGRGYTTTELSFSRQNIGDLPTDLVQHFLDTFAAEARINLHARLLSGSDDHHKAEALFKALGRALDMATQIDERISERIPSTKEVIEG
jgi:imidazoleglycerol-phosphate dehydratase